MEKINLKNEVNVILKTLKQKERDILLNRFGLFEKEASTLASIGKNLSLTRERIRQIQNSALSKIKNSQLQRQPIFIYVQKLTQNQGGLISTKDIEQKLQTNFNYALFILETTKNIKRIKGNKNLNSAFINIDLEQQDILKAEKEIINILKAKTKALTSEKLLDLIESSKRIDISRELAKSLINTSKAFASDWKGRIGLSIWREINPKSARDKSFFILKKEERPLHFTHIAELISHEKFIGKNPTAATVHNELILDPRFVLVGRGIYALAEWGFKGGTVEDVIADILIHNPKGMERDAIIEEVLKTKLVARNTVMMNLLVKKQFKRDEKGLYLLAKSR